MLSLREMIAEETAQPVHEVAAAVTEANPARHGDGVCAVLFYGACLRDGPTDDGLLDFYVLVERYGDIHDSWFAAAANALLPLARGRPRPWMAESGYRSHRPDRVSMRSACPIIFDGQTFTPDPAVPVIISGDRRLTFLSC